MRNLHTPVDQANLVEGLDLGRETTMDAEDLALNDSTNAEVIENLSAVLPGVDVTILAHSLLIKTVDAGDAASLVITTEKCDAVGVLQLEAKEKLEGLDRVVAAIYKVTHEDVAGVRDLAALFE